MKIRRVLAMSKEEVREFLKNSENIKESLLYLLDNTPDISDIRSELLQYKKDLIELRSILDSQVKTGHLSCNDFKRVYNKQRS